MALSCRLAMMNSPFACSPAAMAAALVASPRTATDAANSTPEAIKKRLAMLVPALELLNAILDPIMNRADRTSRLANLMLPIGDYWKAWYARDDLLNEINNELPLSDMMAILVGCGMPCLVREIQSAENDEKKKICMTEHAFDPIASIAHVEQEIKLCCHWRALHANSTKSALPE